MKLIDKLHIAYTQIPGPRNQDVVLIDENVEGVEYVASVVDGFNFRDKIHGNAIGRQASEFVADNFASQFMHAKGKGYIERANYASGALDTLFIEKFPKYVSAVGSFLFHYKEKDIIIALGTIDTFIWKDGQWVKPKEIGNYFLDYPKHYSGSRTLWGFGEVKNNPFYSATPDSLTISPDTPVLIATDGIDDVLSADDLTKLTYKSKSATARGFIAAYEREIALRKTQKDDITLLLRWPPSARLSQF